MMPTRRSFVCGATALGTTAVVFAVPTAHAASAAELNAAADATLQHLKDSEPVTDLMIERAAGILIFPEIIKGGLIVGAAAGEGVLRVGGSTEAYYQSVAASIGMQAGVSKYGYVMFLMDQDALDFVRSTDGWEVGVGPNITVADKGIAKKLSSSTAQEGIYVFFVDQAGLFAGAGLEGSKITPIAK